MGYKEAFLIVFFVSAVSAQSYKVCVSQNHSPATCQSLARDDSQVQCLQVESRVDCALMLATSQADIGYFSEEETILLGQHLPHSHRVVATVRNVNKLDNYAFEAVAVVPVGHTNGLQGLRGGVYCHPGFGQTEVRWSPRVLKTLETLAANTDQCNDIDSADKTPDELEATILNNFFSAACRPGSWSANATVDADLKTRFPNLCSLCGTNSGCLRYTIDMGVAVAGVSNDNTHIQALECLRSNTNGSRPSVAYVAWQHVREFFTTRNPQNTSNFGILCTNGTVIPLSTENLNSATSPCALVRQPWATIVANTNVATNVLNGLKTWWPNGMDPGSNTWQSTLFTVLAGGVNARVVFENTPVLPLNYTQSIRPIDSIDNTASCIPARGWCVHSTNELSKCNWVRAASYILGLQPTISCQLRSNVFHCLTDIDKKTTDFISTGSNYGYVARQHYGLTPVKLVQNSQANAHRVAAFVKESSVGNQNITRFENLRDKKACFPEFGGLSYMAFVRAGHERQVLNRNECDYAKVVGEFFSGACAPGAVDASHALSDGGSSFDSSVLCTSCRSAVTPLTNNTSNLMCAWDNRNQYYGNNGSLACLADQNNDVAFLNIRSISTYLTELGLQANQFRALCRNNSLAINTGVTIDDGCLLAYVVDAEVLTRRNDPHYKSLNVLFDSFDAFFGYTAASGSQLINLEIFSPFGGISDLLFKDSTIGLTEPTTSSTHEPARNYIDLFQHLSSCTSAATDLAVRNAYPVVTVIIMAFITRFVMV